MAEHLICNSYLFKFKHKRKNIGKKQIKSIKQRIINQTEKQKRQSRKTKFEICW